jgi:DNA-binding NarL/FixJ family response regulator/DNA-binding SARP family transcriptional activator
MMASPIRVVVADDHPVMLRGLRALLGALADVELVATASGGVAAVETARAHRPDVVVMDVDMPDLDGISATRALRRELPGTRVLMLSLHADDEHVAAAVGAGAHGYAVKGDGHESLVRAVRAVAAGDAVFGSEVALGALTRVGAAERGPRSDRRLSPDGVRIRMCGALQAELGGRPVAFPGRQGRLVFAYLVAHRDRPVDRDELLDVVWPASPPAAPDAALSTVLTRLRRALGDDVLRGGRALTLELGAVPWIDVERAAADADHAEHRLVAGDAADALESAQRALARVAARYLGGLDGEWIEARRRELADLRRAMLRIVAHAGARLGGAHLARAERAARTLIDDAGVNEPAFAALMRIHAARGDSVAVAQTFAELRSRTLEVLGTVPSRALIALHEELVLGAGADGA